MNFPTAHSNFPNKHLLFQTAWLNLDGDDFAALGNSLEDWYTYDKQNRVLINQGKLDSGEIKLGNQHHAVKITYENGQREKMRFYAKGEGWIDEVYHYDAAGRVLFTEIDGNATSERVYDDLGRLIYQKRYAFGQNGNTENDYSLPDQEISESYYWYNQNGQLEREASYDLVGSDGQSLTDYATEGGGYDSMGMLKGYSTQVGTSTIYYDYSYIGIGASRKVNVLTAEISSVQSTMTHSYDSSGNLVKTVDSALEEEEEDTGTTDFVYNTQGQLLRKTTHRLEDTTPVEVYQDYLFAKGSQIASSGTLDGRSVDQIFQAISSAYPNQAPSQYTVQQGDTLESIAQQLWGDASLWYLIADANGLGGSASLYQGKALTIPNSVIEARNSHDTFKPYSAQQAIGNTTPTLPEPPIASGGGSGGCGVAEILVTVVAVVATVYTAGAAGHGLFSLATSAGSTGAGSVGASVLAGGGALTGAAGAASLGAVATSAFVGGAVGNLAGQATAMGFGLQDSLSGKAALTGGLETMVGAGIGAGLNKHGASLGMLDEAGKMHFGGYAVQATAYAAGSRAVNKMMGNEVSKHFDWRSVAINAAVNSAAPTLNKTLGTANNRYASVFVQTSANYSVSRLFNRDGTQNFVQVAINAFGQTLINDLAVKAGDWMSAGAGEMVAKSSQVGSDSFTYIGNVQTFPVPDEGQVRTVTFGDYGNPEFTNNKIYATYEYELGIDSQRTAYERAIAIKEALQARNVRDPDIAVFDQLIELEYEARIYAVSDNAYTDGVSPLRVGQSHVRGETLDRLVAQGFKLDDSESGYQGALVFDSVLDAYILGNRGTDGDYRDMLTNIISGTGFASQQFTQADTNARLLSRMFPNSVFAGHSLGGAQASLQALKYGKNAVTFNAMGVQDDLLKKYEVTDAQILQEHHLIRSITIDGEFLTTAQRSPRMDVIAAMLTTDIKRYASSIDSLAKGELPSNINLGHLAEARGVAKDLPAVNLTGALMTSHEKTTSFASLHGRSYIHASINYTRQSLFEQLSLNGR